MSQGRRRKRRALLFVLLAALSFAPGCEVLRGLLPSPAPPEVLRLLPLPESAAVTGSDCAGRPGENGFLCVIHAEAPLGMREGSEAASRRMQGWQETSWDWVPGRIQSSWRRGEEKISLAIHELGTPVTKWSLHYLYGSLTDTPPVEPGYRKVAPQPGAKIPAPLRGIPVPAGAKLLEAVTQGDSFAQAVFEVEGDAATLLAPYAELEGWTDTMHARAPWSRSIGRKRDGVQVVMTVWVEKSGPHRLVLVAQPAG